MDREYIVKVMNNSNKVTISNRMTRQRAENFASKIWETVSFSPLIYVAVEDIDGIIICEWEV